MLPAEEFIGKTVLDGYVIEALTYADGHTQIFSAYRDTGTQRYRYSIHRTYISSEYESVENVTRKYAGITKRLSVMNRLQNSSGNMISFIKYKVTGHIDPFAYEIMTVTDLLIPFLKYMDDTDITVLEILKLGVEISNAVKACHNAGIDHNNIIKENIYVDQNGSFVLGAVDASDPTNKEKDIRMLGELLSGLVTNVKSTLLDEQISKAKNTTVSPEEFGGELMNLMLTLPVSLLHSPIKAKSVEQNFISDDKNKSTGRSSKLIAALVILLVFILILVDVTGNETFIPETTVQAIKIISVAHILGEPAVGSTLYAGDIDPVDSKVTYQWQRSFGGDGFEDVPGAVFSEYTVSLADQGAFLRLVVTGVEGYEGSVVSGPVMIMMPGSQVFAAGDEITGERAVNSVLSAGELTPADADVIYQWQAANVLVGPFWDISGENRSYYIIREQDAGGYVRVVITGKGTYDGTEVILPAVYIEEMIKPVISIGAVIGTPRSGFELRAGLTDPADALVTYKWQRAGTRDGEYTDIAGANTDKYTVKAADQGRFIRVMVQGINEYSGTAYSDPVYIQIPQTQTTTQRISLISIGEITGMPRVGNVLTAGSISPAGADVTYQWMSSPTKGGTYTNIPGATSRTFTPGQNEAWRYLRVMVRGSGSYAGTLFSEPTSSVQMPRIAVGMYVQLGTYNNAPVLWRCVGKYGATVTLQSVRILSLKAFDSAKSGVFGTGDGYINMYGNNVWAEANIRQWLNSKDNNVRYSTQAPVSDALMHGYNSYAAESGFLKGFTAKEIDMILPVRHGDVTDVVYLLSESEIKSYLGNSPSTRIRYLTQQAVEMSEYSIGTPDSTWAYWTRTPHASFPSFVRAVGSDGGFYDFVSASGMIGVLPALTLKDDVTLYGKGSIDDPYRFER